MKFTQENLAQECLKYLRENSELLFNKTLNFRKNLQSILDEFEKDVVKDIDNEAVAFFIYTSILQTEIDKFYAEAHKQLDALGDKEIDKLKEVDDDG